MKDNTKRLMRKAQKLNNAVKTTRWLCQVMKCYEPSMKETVKQVLDIYDAQLYAASRGYSVTPPYIGRVRPKLAAKLKKTVGKFGYETDNDFKLELFCFQVHKLGSAFNYDLFVW